MKSIFASKIFWVNLLGGVGMIANVLPPKIAGPVMAALTIALRFVTNQPVGLFPDESIKKKAP